MTTKMLQMVVLLVYACSLILHTTSSASTCYAFRCSHGASVPHTANAHTCTHVCNAVCQCVCPQTNKHTHAPSSLWGKCFHLLPHTENFKALVQCRFSADCASPREKEIPCQMAPKAIQAAKPNTAPKERGTGSVKQTRSRRGMWQMRFFFFFYPIFAYLWWETGICSRIGGGFTANVLHLLLEGATRTSKSPRCKQNNQHGHVLSHFSSLLHQHCSISVSIPH